MMVFDSESNLDRFLRCTTPIVPAYSLPKTQIKNLNPLWYPLESQSVEYFRLGDFWDCFDEWSAYGAGVPIVSETGETLVQYYVPYLSAIQIFTSHSVINTLREETESGDSGSESCSEEWRWEGCSSSEEGFDHQEPLDRLGYSYLQYFERCTPYSRVPLMDKIKELGERYVGLRSLRSVDLSPASWMAVAWYPIYHIPMNRSIKDLSTCFLTYHTLSSSFQDVKREEEKERISVSAFGMATYKMQGRLWDNDRLLSFDVCGVSADWKMEDLMEEEIKVINKTVASDEHVICALSGGVDSTVAATLVHKAIGDRLHCIFVDNGLLRYKEQERVMDTFERDLHLPVTCVDASERFLSELKGVVDPETKRKIIGREFINIFDQFAQELEKKHGKKPAFLVQGTLYPDVIESCPPPGTDRTHSHTIKSHHNVGGLPKDMKLKLIEPLKLLFKDEVRELGRILNVPVGFLKRHPFPGPGLAVRVLGDVTQGNALEVLRQVDEIFIQSIRDAGLYDSIWQAFAVFLPVRSVGVQGDKRTHSHVVALRAVTSQDGMTADWFNFEHKFLDDVSRKICNSVQGVNRVVLDITSKPPSTIEWE